MVRLFSDIDEEFQEELIRSTNIRYRSNEEVSVSVEQRLDDLFDENPGKRGRTLNSENFHVIDKIIDKIEGTESSIKTSSVQEGHFCSALEDIDLLDSWNDNGRYIISGEKKEFEDVRDYLGEKIGTDQISSRKTDLTNMLEINSEDGLAPTTGELNEALYLLTTTSYEYHFGSYGEAVWRSGLDMHLTRRPENELEENLLDIYHRLGRRPTSTEVEKYGDIARKIYEDRYEDGLEEAMNSVGIPTLEQEFENAYRVLVEDVPVRDLGSEAD